MPLRSHAPAIFLLLALVGSARHPAVAWSAPAEAPSLADSFRDPPAEFRPLIITHAMPLNRDDAVPWLAARRAGGAVLDAGVAPGSKDVGGEPWNNPTYLNDPGQFDKLRDVTARIRQQGQRVWIYDELGYPSASAGGRVLQGHPEFQVEVVACRTLPVPAGGSLRVAPELGPVVACWALPDRQGRLDLDAAVDLAAQARGGPFDWHAPNGTPWSICLFERFHPDTWRRHNIPRRIVNILDRRAVARFVQLTHARYAAELGPQMAHVDAFFTDEPQFAAAEHWSGGKPQSVPMIQWCDELPTAFRAKKGYDLADVLPALFHPAGPETGKFRHDFYDVQSDLVAENFFGQVEQWCHGHGVASSGHMLLEESLLFHVMFSGSMLKNWARMDLPGVDLLGAAPYKTMPGWERGRVKVPEDFSCKLASSVAHLTRKQGVFTESFALADKAPLRRVLGVAAWQFAGGITHMSTYAIQWEFPPEDYAQFSDCVGRMAVLARRGTHVADVAVLVPEASIWASFTPPDLGRFEGYLDRNPDPVAIDRLFRDTCHALSAAQRDFDCLGEQSLDEAHVADGRLRLAGEEFRVLVLPEMRMIRPRSLDKLRAFLASGGAAVFVGSLPSQDPAVGEDPKTAQRVAALLAEFPGRLAHLPDLAQSPGLAAWIAERAAPDVVWKGPDTVRLLRRREPDREILFVANPARNDAAGQLTVPGSGDASLWNPETGEVRPLGPLATARPIALEIPAESGRFLVIENGPAPTGASP
ncbi:MAG: glycosyl hydrolase [Thermoguttaceae bacterium]